MANVIVGRPRCSFCHTNNAFHFRCSVTAMFLSCSGRDAEPLATDKKNERETIASASPFLFSRPPDVWGETSSAPLVPPWTRLSAESFPRFSVSHGCWYADGHVTLAPQRPGMLVLIWIPTLWGSLSFTSSDAAFESASQAFIVPQVPPSFPF